MRSRPRCTPLPPCSDAPGRGAVRCLIWEAAATLETYLFYAYCVLVIRTWTYEYAQGRMSIHVYCVLVVRAWTYEYGLNQMYVGGFFTGNRPPVFPP